MNCPLTHDKSLMLEKDSWLTKKALEREKFLPMWYSSRVVFISLTFLKTGLVRIALCALQAPQLLLTTWLLKLLFPFVVLQNVDV